MPHAACTSLADSLSALDDLLPPGEDAAAVSSGISGPSDKDNIRVFVRVRPLSARERGSAGAASRACVSCPPGGGGRVVVLADPAKPEPFMATFDRVLGPEEGQEEVFAAVGEQMVDNVMAGEAAGCWWHCSAGAVCPRHSVVPGPGLAVMVGLPLLVPASSCLLFCVVVIRPLSLLPAPPSPPLRSGFNSSIFVYGQTGAGKTHTITGDAERSEDGALADEASTCWPACLPATHCPCSRPQPCCRLCRRHPPACSAA